MIETLPLLLRRLFLQLDGRLRLVAVAALVGLFGGVASVALNLGLQRVAASLAPLRHCWYGVFFPAVGAALGVVFVRYIVRDSAGHGVPEVIYSISRRGGLLRLRSSFSRLVACLLTIASGGSAGPEAPVVVSGASMGSNVARWFGLDDRQRVITVCCGAAAAIAAIFNAPATGIIFTMEAILEEWAPISVVPIAIASVVGTEVSRLLQGNQIPFEHRSFAVSGLDLTACVGLAVVTAISAIFLVRLVRMVHHRAEHAVGSAWVHAAVGGLMVGVIGMAFPDVLGEGYESVRTIIDGAYAQGLFIIGIVLLAKVLATALTIGSGGSGGVFAPCLLIGSLTGLLFHHCLVALFPGMAWSGEAYYSLLGMAGVMSAVLKAPMTGVFLIVEITGGYDVLVSVVLVSVVSSGLSKLLETHSFYRRELVERGALLKPRTDSKILSELNVMDLLERDCHVVSPNLSLRDFVDMVRHSHRNYFAVEDPQTGLFQGMILLDDIRLYLFDASLYDLVVIADVMNRAVARVSPDQSLVEAMRRFEETHSWSLPVVHNDRFLGLISKATLLDYYRSELLAEEETE